MRPSRPPRWPAALRTRELEARSLVAARAADTAALCLRAKRIQLSAHLELAAPSGAPLSLGLEGIEERYLLAGCADASISLYDVADRPTMQMAPPDARAPLVRATKRSCTSAHTHAVSCVQWFPHDTGAFISSGFDATVKLWDTNTMSPVCSFNAAGRVHCSCMSNIASNHNLIATCSDGDGGDVVLMDPLVGHTAHRLSGHRDVTWSLCWSRQNDYELFSGGSDGSLRLWDIRKNIHGCLRAFDQNDTSAKRAAAARSSSSRAALQHHSPADSSSFNIYDAIAAEQRAGHGIRGDPANVRRSWGGSLQSGSLAATARRLADPKAHNGGITSLALSSDGSVLLSAGRDHRLRLWNTNSGVNLLVHYEDSYNSTRTYKQLALSTCLGKAGSYVYFPSSETLRVYDLYNGELVHELKGHFGEVHCAAAASEDFKVFSGGDDCAIISWTPPSCGLTVPAPVEECKVDGFGIGSASLLPRRADQQGRTCSIVDFIEQPSAISDVTAPRSSSACCHGARQIADADGDAWSDEDMPPPQVRRPSKRRRRGG